MRAVRPGRGSQLVLASPCALVEEVGAAQAHADLGVVAQVDDVLDLCPASLVERVTRIELALSAWEADVLPLNYTRERLPDYLATSAAWEQP